MGAVTFLKIIQKHSRELINYIGPACAQGGTFLEYQIRQEKKKKCSTIHLYFTTCYVLSYVSDCDY